MEQQHQRFHDYSHTYTQVEPQHTNRPRPMQCTVQSEMQPFRLKLLPTTGSLIGLCEPKVTQLFVSDFFHQIGPRETVEKRLYDQSKLLFRISEAFLGPYEPTLLIMLPLSMK